MKRTQLIIPDSDRHIELEEEYDTEDENHRICVRATVDGEIHPQPDVIYNYVKLRNSVRNEVSSIVDNLIPESMKKELLDSDGDPTGIIVIKDKHMPVYTHIGLEDKILCVIPGATEELLSSIREAVSKFGDSVTIE